MAERFQSGAKAAAFLAENPEVESQVEQKLLHSHIVTTLINLRTSKGITQKEVAERMGCDPSKISKLEAGDDLGLKWPDIVTYLAALNVNMSIFLEDKDLPASDRIKHCVFRIHDSLQGLVELAKQADDDDEITDKIHRFYGEVLFNFLARFEDSYTSLSSVIRIPEGKDQSRLLSQVRNPEVPTLDTATC